MANRAPRWVNAGDALDCLLNVLLLNGDKRQSISQNTAQRALQGAGWACVLCRLLDVIVERDHCAKSLGPEPTSLPASIRSGIALVALCFALWLCWRGIRWGFGFL